MVSERSQDRSGPILTQAAALLMERLRQELVPSVLHAEDALQLAYPGAESDFRLGVNLYDLEAIHTHGSPAMVRLDESTRRLPDLVLALHFLLFSNRKAPFHSMEPADEMLLLDAAARAVHSMGPLSIPTQETEAHLTFEPLTLSEKQTFWQAVGQPFQPALYLTLAPVILPDTRLIYTPPVRSITVSTTRKESV